MCTVKNHLPTGEEGRAMVETARKYERVVQTGTMQRSWKNFRTACELVRNGYVGEIKEVFVSVGDPPLDCNLPGQPEPENLNWDRWLRSGSKCGHTMPFLLPL